MAGIPKKSMKEKAFNSIEDGVIKRGVAIIDANNKRKDKIAKLTLEEKQQLRDYIFGKSNFNPLVDEKAAK